MIALLLFFYFVIFLSPLFSMYSIISDNDPTLMDFFLSSSNIKSLSLKDYFDLFETYLIANECCDNILIISYLNISLFAIKNI